MGMFMDIYYINIYQLVRRISDPWTAGSTSSIQISKTWIEESTSRSILSMLFYPMDLLQLYTIVKKGF